MSSSPGAYITQKARHDRNVAEQFHDELARAGSEQAIEQLAGLIGLAQQWLSDLLVDADSSGLSDLAAAVHAARAAACSDADPLQAAAGLEPALVEVIDALRGLTEESQRSGTAAESPAEPALNTALASGESSAVTNDAGTESASQHVASSGDEPASVVGSEPAADADTMTTPAQEAVAIEPGLEAASGADVQVVDPSVVESCSASQACSADAANSLSDASTPIVTSDPLSALDRLARQLEEMCPRWGVTSEPNGEASLVDAITVAEGVTPAGIPETDAAAHEPAESHAATADAPATWAALEAMPQPGSTDATLTVSGDADAHSVLQQDSPPAGEAIGSCAAEPEPASLPAEVPDLAVASPVEPPFEAAATDSPITDAEEGTRSEPTPEPAPTEASDTGGAAFDTTVQTVAASADQSTFGAECTPEPVSGVSTGMPDSPPLSGDLTPEQIAALMAEGMPEACGESWGSTPLNLPPERLESLQFLVAGVSDHFKSFRTVIWELSRIDTREDGAGLLRDCARKLGELTNAFTLTSLRTIRDLLVSVAEGVCVVPEGAVPELLVRVAALGNLIDQALRGLEVGMEVRWPLDTISERVGLLLRGEVLHPDLQGWHEGDFDRVLELDRVSEPFNNPPTPEASVAPPGSTFPETAAWRHVLDRRLGPGDRRAGGDPAADRRGYGTLTLRVPVTSVERMAAMVADLIQTKNLLAGVIDKALSGRLSPSDMETARSGAADLARLSSGLDVTLTMMQVRLQAISHLFDRFPRVLRDVASIADKSVELRTEPGDVQIDKQMFDALSDPLGQLLRCVVTRWIQPPAERAASGRSSTAVITLAARSKGTRVLITVTHDGSRPTRQEIIERAVELDMLTPSRAAGMSDSELMAMLFDEHYCDPELSKVASGLKSLGASISVVVDGDTTSLVIAAPLSVSVLDTIMVGVGDERYGLPVSAVDEITQVATSDLSTVRGQPVLRRRDGVVGVIDLPKVVRGAAPEAPAPSTAVVIRTERHRAAVLVSAVLAKQEVVVRALDSEFASARIFSGATISGDGRVNLILDVDRLAEHVSEGPPAD